MINIIRSRSDNCCGYIALCYKKTYKFESNVNRRLDALYSSIGVSMDSRKTMKDLEMTAINNNFYNINVFFITCTWININFIYIQK